MADGQRPVTVGFWFALGHSTVVVVMALLVAAGTQVAGTLMREDSGAHQVLGVVATSTSGVFLYVIGIVNLVALVGIVRVFRRMRAGAFDEQQARAGPRLPRPAGPPHPAGDGVGRAAVADVPGRAGLRPRLRHRQRDRAAGAGRGGCGVRAALVRRAGAAAAVRGRHVAVRHPGRRVHERRLRLGVRQPDPQGLLQPHDHRPVGRRGRAHRQHRA
nr:hypothetical protein [Angustibacter aerolatus]